MTRSPEMTREEERAAVVRWLREDVGAELIRMRLVAGLPGGTAHQRAKQRAKLDGMDFVHAAILKGIESGAHLSYGEPG